MYIYIYTQFMLVITINAACVSINNSSTRFISTMSIGVIYSHSMISVLQLYHIIV